MVRKPRRVVSGTGTTAGTIDTSKDITHGLVSWDGRALTPVSVSITPEGPDVVYLVAGSVTSTKFSVESHTGTTAPFSWTAIY